ncbi:hypothetical protein OF83DRAFT_1170592 [Amylostereum chailletii]|nr:hypothetical protein OF83DRAFT_1170592 [Amylostereum chailletii]
MSPQSIHARSHAKGPVPRLTMIGLPAATFAASQSHLISPLFRQTAIHPGASVSNAPSPRLRRARSGSGLIVDLSLGYLERRAHLRPRQFNSTSVLIQSAPSHTPYISAIGPPASAVLTTVCVRTQSRPAARRPRFAAVSSFDLSQPSV